MRSLPKLFLWIYKHPSVREKVHRYVGFCFSGAFPRQYRFILLALTFQVSLPKESSSQRPTLLASKLKVWVPKLSVSLPERLWDGGLKAWFEKSQWIKYAPCRAITGIETPSSQPLTSRPPSSGPLIGRSPRAFPVGYPSTGSKFGPAT